MLGACLAVLLTAGPAAPAPTPAAAPAGRPFSFVLSMGIDVGGEDIVEVEFDDGSSETLSANQGFWFAGGFAFLKQPIREVAIDTAVTIGFKGWEVGADNGQIKYRTFPVEVVERLWFRQVRFGAGVSYLLSPKISSDGDLSDFGSIPLKNSLGLVGQFEWIGNRAGRAGFMLGARGVWQKLEAKGGSGAVSANSFGLYLGAEL